MRKRFYLKPPMSMLMKRSKSILTFSSAKSRSSSIESTQSDNMNGNQPRFVFSVVVTRQYDAGNVHELSVKVSDLLHVIEDTDAFYYCFNPENQQEGFIPKNYAEKQKPFSFIFCRVKKDAVTAEGIYIYQEERLVLLAKYDSDLVVYKKSGEDSQNGKIDLIFLELEGDLSSLPTYSDYVARKSLYKSGNHGRTRTPKDSLKKPTSESQTLRERKLKDEDKVLEKLMTRKKSTRKIQQLFKSQPQY